MKGILKRYYAAGWVVEYQHQLTISCTQRKELQVHPDDLDSVFNVGVEVDFYIVEVEKMSGTVQYAKLITESHSDQVIDIMNDEKSLEISDKEIIKAARDYEDYDSNSSQESKAESTGRYHGFKEGIKWFREQLNNKQ